MVLGIEHDGDLVGGVVLFNHVDGAVELGCWALARAEGFGVVRAACLAALHQAKELGAVRVVWQCDPRNERSAALARRLGFVHEGTLRSSYVVRGERLDTAVYSLVGDEIDRALGYRE